MLSIFDQSKTSTTQTSPDHFSGVAFTTGNHGYSIFKDERECRPLPLEVIWQTFTLGMDYCNFTGAWKDPQCVYKSHKKDPQCVYKSHVANKTVHLGWPNSCLRNPYCVSKLLQASTCLKKLSGSGLLQVHTLQDHLCVSQDYCNWSTQKLWVLNLNDLKVTVAFKNPYCGCKLMQAYTCLRRL